MMLSRLPLLPCGSSTSVQHQGYIFLTNTINDLRCTRSLQIASRAAKRSTKLLCPLPVLYATASHSMNNFAYTKNQQRWLTDSKVKRKIPPKPSDEEKSTIEYQNRHFGIQLHPDTISSLILPGNMVLKEKKNGIVQKRYTELVYGYFWMIKDIEKCDGKPIISNTSLISERDAKVFPALPKINSLSKSGTVEFPEYFVRKNRSHDPTAQCTVVAISFRDFGYQQLASWLDPIRKHIKDVNHERIEVITLNVAEGFLNKWFFRPLITALTKRNTAPENHDSTFLYYASGNNTGQSMDPMEAARDVLRMHNTMVGYIFLLDGIGRVRFAGSGSATQEEIDCLIKLTKDLTPLLSPSEPLVRSSATSRSATAITRKKGLNKRQIGGR